jgi:hypothetical protein
MYPGSPFRVKSAIVTTTWMLQNHGGCGLCLDSSSEPNEDIRATRKIRSTDVGGEHGTAVKKAGRGLSRRSVSTPSLSEYSIGEVKGSDGRRLMTAQGCVPNLQGCPYRGPMRCCNEVVHYRVRELVAPSGGYE